VMVLQMTNDPALLDDLPAETVQQMQQQARQMDLPTTLYAIKRFSTAVNELKGGFQPQLPLEMALIEVVQGEAAAPTIVTATAPYAAARSAGVSASQDAAKPAPIPSAPTATNATAKSEPVALDAETARRLWSRWKEYLAVVKTQCGQQAAAALQAVRDVAVTDHAVALAFGSNEFSRNLIAKPDVLPDVAAALSKFLGREVSIECQLGEKAVIVGQLVNAQEVMTEGPDPLVEYAVKDLGAQVTQDVEKRAQSGRKASPV